MPLNMTSQSLICKYLFGCGILIIIIISGPTSLNKDLKHIKLLKVISLSQNIIDLVLLLLLLL